MTTIFSETAITSDGCLAGFHEEDCGLAKCRCECHKLGKPIITTRFDIQVRPGDKIHYRSKVGKTSLNAEVVKGNYFVTFRGINKIEVIERVVITAPILNLTLTADAFVIERGHIKA